MEESLNREKEPQQNQPEIMEKQQPSLGQILEYSQFKADITQQDLEKNPSDKNKQRIANQWSGARDVIYEVALKNKDIITSTEDLKTALERYQDWLDKKDKTADNNEQKQIKLQKVKFSDAQRLIENFDFHNLESPFFKEWKSKKDKETESKKQESQTVEKAKTEQEIKEEKLMIEILTDGGVGINTALHGKHHPNKENGGFTAATDNRIMPGQFNAGSTRNILHINDWTKKYEDAKVMEVVTLVPDVADVYQEREVQVQKKRLGGLLGSKMIMQKQMQKVGERPVMHNEKVSGGKAEPLVRLIYLAGSIGYPKDDRLHYDATKGGRSGNYLMTEILLPKSVAEKTMEEIKSNPAFIRKIAHEVVTKKIKIPENVWQEGDDTEGQPVIRPPYENWDAAGSKMYIKEPNDGDFKPERVISVKPKK